jgi:hypothetical protein
MTEPTKKHRQRAAELIFPMMVTSAWVDDPNATYGLDTAGLARLVVTAQAFADFEASLSESRGELRASERQGGDGWVKATALPPWLPGIYWLKYDDGSVGERTARRENGGWHYGGGGREHATVIEFCKAVPPVSRPALSADAALPRWVPVAERLPEDGLMVLFWHQDWPTDSNLIGLGRYTRDDDDGSWWEDVSEQDMSGDATVYYSGVTHWAPLPAPPEVKP